MEDITYLGRKELKIITRRLQGGRVRSVEEGNYLAPNPPYGYIIKELDNGRTLEPHPQQAPVVKLIFDRYTIDKMGSSKIAAELNHLGYLTYTGKSWSSSSVLTIIKNAVYTGIIQWKKKEEKKSSENYQKKKVRTRPREEWIEVQGKHEPLITMETFQKAQEILSRKYHVPYQLENGITNPLAGLVKCGYCESAMIKRPYSKQQPHFRCSKQGCQNKSTRFSYVEEKLIYALKEWLKDYRGEWEKYKRPSFKDTHLEMKETALHSSKRELKELENQKNKLHDFLERGIYDEETFLERSTKLIERIEHFKEVISQIEIGIELEKKRKKEHLEIIPQVEHILDLYDKTDDPSKKNKLLKSILNYAVYKKEKYQRGDQFTLEIYPRL